MKQNQIIKSVITAGAVAVVLLTHSMGFASIPDDVDTQKYKNIYLDAKQISDQKRSIADDLDSQLKITAGQISDTENDISTKESEISKLNQYISELNYQNRTLTEKNSKLNSQIDHNQRNIQNNRREVQTLKAGLTDTNVKLDRVSRRYNKVLNRKRVAQKNLNDVMVKFRNQKNRLVKLRQKKQSLESEIANKQNRVQTITAKIQDLKRFKQNIKTIQANLRTKINNLTSKKKLREADLASAKAVKNRQTTNLNKVKAVVNNLKTQADVKRQEIRRAQQGKGPKKKEKVAKLRAEFQAIKTKLDTKKQRMQQVQNNLSTTKQKIKNIKSNISNVQNRLSTAKNKFQSNKSKITQVDPKIANLRSKRNSIKNSLPTLKQELSTVVSKIQNVRARFQQTKNNKIDAENQLANINTRLNKVSDRLGQLKNRQARLKQSIRSFKDANNEMLDQNIRYSNQIDANRDRIISNKDEELRAGKEISYLEQVISRLNNELDRLITKENSLKARFYTANSEASAAEQYTQGKYAKYQQVQNQYDSEIAQARQDGGSQGVVLGEQAGVSPGNRDGLAVGKSEGDSFGTKQGLLMGYIDGLVEGKDKGKEQGYQHGSESDENHLKGYQLGYKQGVLNAKAIAKRENYFPSRAKLKRQLLAKALTKSISVDNGTARGKKLFELVKQIASAENRSPSSGNMIPAIFGMDESWEGLITLIENIRLEINSIPKKAVVDRNTGVVTFPISVDVKKANCQKRYTDFTQACKDSFVESYQGGFKITYKQSFIANKVKGFNGQRDKAISKAKNKRVSEGYQYAHPIAYAHWDKVGAEEAINEGRIKGLKEGLEQNIVKERTLATEKGVVDENKFFATNPVLRTRSVNFKKVKDGKNTEVIAGDEILLSAVVTNHGAVASKEGQAKVKWEALTSNVIIDSSLQPLVAIPADTKANITSIAYAKIDPVAVLSEVVKIKVTSYMPDDEVQEEIIEFKTKQHLNTQIQANVEKEIANGFDTEFVLIKVFNNSKVNSPKNISAVMSFGGYKGADKGKSSHNYGNLKAGATGSKMFTYSLNRRARAGDRFQVTVTVYFGSQVSAKRVYNVKVVEDSCEDWDECD